MQKPFELDESVRSALETYKAQEGLTHAELARRIGDFTVTRITKYLGLNKPGALPEPDAGRIQSAARNYLRHVGRNTAHRQSLFDNDATTLVADGLRLIRKIGKIGLLWGRAGVGKTCGAELFCRENPNTIMLTATRYRRDYSAIVSMLFDELDSSAWPKNVSRAVWMERALRGTERLIIVDNAHKLAFTGLEFLFDFHDATGSAIALIGNPEVLALVRGNDQLHSRIGPQLKIENGDDADHRATARQLIIQLCPDSGDTLIEKASNLIAATGHVRVLNMQLLLTREMFALSKDWLKAWDLAIAARQINLGK